MHRDSYGPMRQRWDDVLGRNECPAAGWDWRKGPAYACPLYADCGIPASLLQGNSTEMHVGCHVQVLSVICESAQYLDRVCDNMLDQENPRMGARDVAGTSYLSPVLS